MRGRGRRGEGRGEEERGEDGGIERAEAVVPAPVMPPTTMMDRGRERVWRTHCLNALYPPGSVRELTHAMFNSQLIEWLLIPMYFNF